MRIAALYDIHGNLPALDAVLEEVANDGVDAIVIGGDVVPGPMPRECLQRLAGLQLPTHFIQGNGDRAVASLVDGVNPVDIPPAFRQVIRWVADELDSVDGTLLQSWPKTFRLTTSLGAIFFCHATPRNDVDIFTRNTDAKILLPMFDETNAAIVVCGHTHMQFDRKIGRTRVINAGSVGMPFGKRGAYWLMIDEDSTDLRRTEYDYERAAELIRSTEYPDAEAFASTNILNPPTEADMLAAFDSKSL
jgi:putative phosphoesterase